MIFLNDLLKEIEKAEHALILYIDDLVAQEVLTSCLSAIDKGLSLDIFLSIENKIFLKENLFLLNTCIQLVDKGARIFMIDDHTDSTTWKSIVDFKEIIYYSLSAQKIIYEKEEDNSFLTNEFLEFERKKEKASPYLAENGDLQINFNVSEPTVISGDPVELKWEVKGANKVIIQGLGEVEAFGRKKIIPTKDTLLKIGASNKRQSQIKVIPVRVSEKHLTIQYDLGFINTGTKQYASLVNSDIYPHTYGISKGHQVKFTWKVPKAQSITIMPFSLSGTSGEFYFTPSDSLTICINAMIGSNSITRKIQVLLFPVPLFKEKLFSAGFLKNKQQVLFTPLSKKEQTEKIRKEGVKRYKELTQKVNNHYLQTRHKKFNLKSINIFLFDVLREKFSHRKGILQQINAIRSHYEQPYTGKGTSDRSPQPPA